MSKPTKSSRYGQKGAALFFALIFILILSMLGVSILFVSQAESWSSLNYLEMTQARYGAEAGLNSAADYLVNTYCGAGNTTCSNGSSPASGDTISLYNTNVSPVTLVSNGSVVTLSTTSSAATYPVASVESAFRSAAAGSLASGTHTVNYTATATLVAMNSVTTASGTQTVQTWNITGGGSIAGIRSAQVQVTGTVEQQVQFAVTSAPSYGVFAVGTGCDAINLSGNPLITSYSSAKPLVSGSVQLNSFGGNVGSNGNLTAAGSSTVEGTLSTPRTGVETGKKAACSSGAVNAGDYTGTSTVTGCSTTGPVSPATSCTSTPVQLSQNVSYTAPTMPGSAPTFNTNPSSITIGGSTTCANLNITSGCAGSGGNLTFTPPLTITCGASCGSGIVPSCGVSCSQSGVTSLPALTVNSTALLTINPGGGTITFNGMTQSNGGQITINATSAMTVNTTSLTTSGSQSFTINNSAPVTLNAWGNSSGTGVNLGSGTALSMSGSSIVTLNIASTATAPFSASGAWSNTNSTGVPTPAMFQINYGGSSQLNVEAGSAAAAAIFAPAATVDIVGGATFYGSIICTTLNDTNGANIYYDTQMGGTSGSGVIATVQPFMMDSFSWSRF